VPRPPRDADASTATRNILEAAARQIASGGAAALALSDVAREAGISKALIHYHFRDKDTLLSRLVDHVARDLVARERAALADYVGQHNPLAVDALWSWLEAELRRGDIRVLLELDSCRGAAVQQSARDAAALRRRAAKETIEQLFTILDLRPRIEASLLASVLVAFVDGLAIDTGIARGEASATTARVAFDVFWLAMLSLAE
jgi:AcrR family transcriptional regulator